MYAQREVYQDRVLWDSHVSLLRYDEQVIICS